MSILSSGQEYNPVIGSKIRETAKSAISGAATGARMGLSQVATETVSSVFGDTAGNIVGGMLMPGEKKEKADRIPSDKKSLSDYFAILKDELRGLVVPTKKTAEEVSKQTQESKKSETKPKQVVSVAGGPVVDDAKLARVANATEMTEEASVEQVDVLEKMKNSIQSIEQALTNTGATEEEKFESERLLRTDSKSLMSQYERDFPSEKKGPLDAILGAVSSFKGLGDSVKSLSAIFTRLGPLMGAVAKGAAVLGPAVAVAGAAFAGFKIGEWISDKFEEKTGNSIGSTLYDDHDRIKGWFGFSDKDKELKEEKRIIQEKVDQAKKSNKPISKFVATKAAEHKIDVKGLTVTENKSNVTVTPTETKTNVSESNSQKNISQTTNNSKVESVTESAQTRISNDVVNNTETLSKAKQEKESAPIVVNNAPTINNTQTSSGESLSYSSLNHEPTFRRLKDRLMSAAII